MKASERTHVYVLQDDLYETTLSAHATEEDAQAAIERHLAGEVTRHAERWWESFGAGSKHAERYPPKFSTFEEFLASEVACARENLRIEEHDLS